MCLSRFALIVLTLTAFAACGQSGPLYLPGNPSDVQEVPSTPSNDLENDDGDDAAP